MTFKTEFAIEMTCQGCANTVEKALAKAEGVSRFDIDVANKIVTVEGTAPPSKIHQILRDTGKTVIVRGQSAVDGNHLGAAVCIFHDSEYLPNPQLADPGHRKGLARIVQVSPDVCAIDVTVSGLTPGPHGIHIHALGNISAGAASTGPHFNPTGVTHGDSETGHVGDLGNIMVRADGWGDLLLESRRIRVDDIIGRSVVITQAADDLGRRGADDPQSGIDGNSGPGVLCGIVARSAGAFQNTKQVCECSGKTLWEEAKESQL
ncbi:copper chaperone [Dimargaris cristalligena]|nr:copper chaperone [Dimargaris cristalligena]